MVDTLGFAKILLNTGHSGLTRDDYHAEIEKRAAKNRLPHETVEQSYVRQITETEEGKTLFKALKAAPVPTLPLQTQAAQDFVPRSRGPASDKMDQLVDEFERNYARANSKKLTRQPSYERVFNDERNRILREQVKAEERSTTSVVADARAPITSAWRAAR